MKSAALEGDSDGPAGAAPSSALSSGESPSSGVTASAVAPLMGRTIGQRPDTARLPHWPSSGAVYPRRHGRPALMGGRC